MILGLLILVVAGLFAWLGGWLAVAIAAWAVVIASALEMANDVFEYVLWIALAGALCLTLYDIWWHNVPALIGAAAAGARHEHLLLVSELVLLTLLLAKMVKAFNGR